MVMHSLKVNPTRQEVRSENFQKIKEFYEEKKQLTLPSKDPDYAKLCGTPSNDNVIALIAIRFVRFSRLDVHTSLTRFCPRSAGNGVVLLRRQGDGALVQDIYSPRVNWSNLFQLERPDFAPTLG